MIHNIAVSLVILGQLSMSLGQEIINKVVCLESTEEQDIRCGDDEIIDIQSVTIAYTTNWRPCTVGHLIPLIEGLSEDCKSSSKEVGKYAWKVAKRCHGNQSCTIDKWVVNQQHLKHLCSDRGQQEYRANVLWFNYTCFQVGNAVLLPFNGKVIGSRLNIFSPYFPCDTPRGQYEVKCRVIPRYKSEDQASVRFTIVLKLVKFLKAQAVCGDYLYFRKDNSTEHPRTYYCNDANYGTEAWNAPPVTIDAYNELEISYKIGPGGVGGKFWLQIKATEDEHPVWLDVTCSGQDIRYPEASCSPLISTTPPPTSTITTTTSGTSTATSTVQNAGNENNATGQEGTSEPSDNSDTLLMGVLGGVIALVLIIACVAVFLFYVIRKKKREKDRQKKVPPITPPRRPRPMSIQKITALMKGKKKAPNLYEEPRQKTEVEGTKPKQKPPRPSSIQKMAALLKSKGKPPPPPKVKPTTVKEENIAVVQPQQMYATVDKKKKKGANNEAPEGADAADNTHTYAVPNKKKNKPSKDEELTHNDADETVMYDNDDLYSPANESNDNDNELRDQDMYEAVNSHETDDVIEDNENDIGYDDPNLYADVQSQSKDEDIVDERRQSVVLPDNYPNEPYSRTSLV